MGEAIADTGIQGVGSRGLRLTCLAQDSTHGRRDHLTRNVSGAELGEPRDSPGPSCLEIIGNFWRDLSSGQAVRGPSLQPGNPLAEGRTAPAHQPVPAPASSGPLLSRQSPWRVGLRGFRPEPTTGCLSAAPQEGLPKACLEQFFSTSGWDGVGVGFRNLHDLGCLKLQR